jgi:hypothetical protein
MSTPRRSARLAPQSSSAYQQQQRSSSSAPAFAHTSQPSSTSSTSYPSPTNDSNIRTAHPGPSQSHSHPRLQVQSSIMSQHHHSHLNAPLPSPSAGDGEPFFGRPHSQPNPYSSHPHHQNPQQASAFGLPQQHLHHNSFSQQNSHPGQPGHMPHDFLAEAAKRAQMACLMRDLGDVSL